MDIISDIKNAKDKFPGLLIWVEKSKTKDNLIFGRYKGIKQCIGLYRNDRDLNIVEYIEAVNSFILKDYTFYEVFSEFICEDLHIKHYNYGNELYVKRNFIYKMILNSLEDEKINKYFDEIRSWKVYNEHDVLKNIYKNKYLGFME